jgi:hypothetical protein
MNPTTIAPIHWEGEAWGRETFSPCRKCVTWAEPQQASRDDRTTAPPRFDSGLRCHSAGMLGALAAFEMPRTRYGLALLCLTASACSGPETTAAPEHVQTSAFAVPASSGSGLAMVFEADLVAIGNGGVSTQVAGPSVAVGVIGAGAGEVLDTFEAGSTDVLLGPTSAWVLQRSTTAWTSTLGDPPTTPFTHVTRVDRTSLKETGSLTFSEPLVNPAVLSDSVILDAVPSTSSDVARAVFLRAYDLDGAAAPTSLVSDQGFAAAACFASGGAVLAYEPTRAVGTISVVAAQPDSSGWTLPRMSIPHYRLDPTAIGCSDDAGRALLSVIATADGQSHVLLVDIIKMAVVVDAVGLQGPLALRGDGAAGLALETSNQGLVFFDASTQIPVAVPGVVALQQPWQAGDLTLWTFGEEEDTVAVVHLADGSIDPTFDAGVAPLVSAWPAGPGFVVGQEDDNGPGDLPLTRLSVLRSGQVESLPLGSVLNAPSLAAIAGSTLYTLTSPTTSGGADAAAPATASLQVYDLDTGSLTSTLPLPVCNTATAEAMKGCSP